MLFSNEQVYGGYLGKMCDSQFDLPGDLVFVEGQGILSSAELGMIDGQCELFKVRC